VERFEEKRFWRDVRAASLVLAAFGLLVLMG
jgi:hypothetical protein